jgi:predicted ATP-binding protein involved in virulence
MLIKSLSLQNFRNIAQENTQQFDDHFTAIIGINGKGKSTWLQAMRIACGAYFLGISHVQSRHIVEDEIRKITIGKGVLKEQTPVIIAAEGIFTESTEIIKWKRAIPLGKSKITSSEADIGKIRALGKAKFDKMNAEETDKLDLPLVAYFGTSRIFGATRNTAKPSIGKQIFKDGYANWFEMRANAYKYPNWLGSYDGNLKNNAEYEGTKEAFYQCLKTANKYIEEADFYNGALWLKIAKKSHEYTSELLPLQFHSDGVIAVTDMIAELAYRCIVLNGYKGKDAIKETKGVVMIDELDLHLHPSWQKHIVADLKAAFPNIQFIVTTHSPFIIQSLSSQEIINLDESELEGEPNRSSLEEVAEYEMGVPNAQRSQKFIDMQTAAAEFFALIKAGETDEAKITIAKRKLDELRVSYGDDPAYMAFLEAKQS